MPVRTIRPIKFISIFLLLCFSTCVKAQVFWIEDFGTAPVCDQGNEADNTITANGIWTVNDVGIQDAFANEWYISATEPGFPAGTCSVEGCDVNSIYTNRTLHIGNVPGSPNATTICPTGDCGAVYDPGGFQNVVLTNKRAESPVIDCSGRTGIVLSFLYFENGDPLNADNCFIEYFDGTSWINIADPGRTDPNCGQGFGTWTLYAVNLPASADNNPNVRIGFRWENDNGGVGVNPSFAVDNVQLSSSNTPVAGFFASSTSICVNDCIDFTDTSTNSPTSYSWTFIGGSPSVSSFPNPSNICFSSPGTYTVQLIVSNAAGTDTLTIPNYITVNPCVPPDADFSADSTVICERSCVNFFDQSTNGPTAWQWFFPGGTPASSNSPNPQNICYQTPGSYDVTLIATNNISSDTLTIPGYIQVNVCPLPEAAFTSSNTVICANRCVSFTDLSTENPTSWLWSFPGATPSTSTDQNPQNICYTSDGLYDVRLVVSNQYGSDTLELFSYIQVESVPGAFVSPDTSMDFGSSYQLLAGGGISYSWSPAAGLDSTNIPNPVASPGKTTTYVVVITDALGCQTTRQVTVRIIQENRFFVPNTFTPNRDGRNDYLFVRGNNLYGLRFTVYDRWGNKVFETVNQSEGWDGTYKGKLLDPAVFTYILTVNYEDGKTVTETGNVTLIR
ncbi:MAG: PKD domain-containing protein [Bacteroidetes bacterium]|nr:MAG: PKD domain-containing protein [Bacteroidota bacterium]REK04754.1 MAG: PKD domain-containing protein [Bacteroidota bacterium]REK36228.1 MAG: PKD domain-containing protein [Bacteroidota bacterium]REK51110.1 MAG: PKD domain-containing protein [Bacteroidota bacterium]